MRNVATGVYRGVSGRQRQAVRREALLDAAYDLLGSDGWSATSVRAVCRRAGLTARYFYESFADLDALLAAVFDRVAEELRTVVLDAVAEARADAHAKAGAAIGAFARYLTADRRRARIVFSEAIGSDILARRRYEALHAFAHLILEQAEEFYARRAGSDSLPSIAAFVLAGGLAELLVAWLDGEVKLTQDELIEHCTVLFVATGEAALALSSARSARR